MMSHRLATAPVAWTLTAVLALGALAPSRAGASASRPTRSQIAAALHHAESSRYLWATVNVCNFNARRPQRGKVMGVRVQMPGLGFTTRLYIGIQIEFWSETKKRFVSTTTRLALRSLGQATHGVHQGGAAFTFKPPVSGRYILRGVATFEWRLGDTVLGRVSRKTGHGYRHVDFSRPPGYSAGTCTLTP